VNQQGRVAVAGHSAERVCLGVVGAPHGVRGQIRIRTFTEAPEDVAAYGPVTDDVGRVWRLSIEAPWKAGVIARIEGIRDRDAAERLKGQKLYVERQALPEPDEETYYHADLIGLEVRLAGGAPVGRIVAVQDFGAGDLLDIRLEAGGSVLLPFTAEAVPEVRIAEGYVVAAPTPELTGAEAAP
jgi:16S rRNA processing protein RimM